MILGMYSFILEEHKETYSVFYKEITGKSLQKVSLLDPGSKTSGVKRRVQQSASKEEPKIKKSKSEQKVSQQNNCTMALCKYSMMKESFILYVFD